MGRKSVCFEADMNGNQVGQSLELMAKAAAGVGGGDAAAAAAAASANLLFSRRKAQQFKLTEPPSSST